MHVADIDPDSPGLEIFNVYEEGERAPYGWALRDAETGDVRFGEYAEEDLGRCMIGKIDPNTRGLQVWVKDVYDVNGRTLELPTPGTNMKIYWAGDLSTQITDGADYLHGDQYGVINDLTHGVMLQPAGTATNNGTKGNPCLVADVLGDFREELLVRTADDTAIRIYTTTDLTPHKLFTLMHDAQYRCGVAWQNNCYNQPCYPSFYYAGDMDFANVLPQLNAKPTLWMAGDSIMQSYAPGDKPVTGWGEVLHTLAQGDAVCRAAHRADCPFPQEMRYELPGLVIDNCAMAGRSSKTFREEGRLDDIAAHIRPGDLLVVSFGHNDANRAKAERYVPADAFGESRAPSGTLPAATVRCASLSPPWRCASLTRPVSATPRLPPTARRCAPLPPRSAHRLSTLAPLPPPPTPPLALSAARPAICGWAQSRTTPTSKAPAPAARHRPLCSSFCRIPPRHWMCCGRISNKF